MGIEITVPDHITEVFESAIQKWGRQKQIEMIEEEAIELALAVRKYLRKGETDETKDNIVDELADIQVMVYQSIYLFPELHEKVVERFNYKVSRLKRRISESN